MKLSEIIELSKPNYKYYKIIPNNSIKNNSTNKIARTIASLYKNILNRAKAKETKMLKVLGKEYEIVKKIRYELYEKIGYFIYIEKKEVGFYFIIPDNLKSILHEKIKDAWGSVTINEVNELPQFSDKSEKYTLQYKRENPLSLSTDRRSNELLRSNLNIINVLGDNDRVGIFYNFIPTTQKSWKHEYKYTMDKMKKNEPVDRDKGNLMYISKLLFSWLLTITNDITNVFTSKDNNEGLGAIIERAVSGKELSSSTIKKENNMVIDTQVVLFSESDNKFNQTNNAKSLIQSFDAISEDNSFIAKKTKAKININKFKLNAPINRTGDEECQNFISVAGRDLLEEYNFIDKVDTQETQVPDELQNGVISIGENTYRGNKQIAYLSNDREYKNLTTMLIGPTRAGKSTLIGNISNDALNNNECVVMFDFIGNCELSSEVSELFPEDKVLNIECNDFETIQGLGYNEVGIETDPFKQYDNAKKQTTQLLTLVNSINSDDIQLSAKMERYLTSASLIVFINNGSIKDVFSVLQNHNVRNSMINKIPNNQKDNLLEYITSLGDLDDLDKDGNIKGTKLNLIVGIIDRLNKLKNNTYMELMLKKGTENNIDLSEEIQKNQLICLRMPEDMFSTDGERDVYTTYWITKLWLALQMRKKKIKDRNKLTKVNLIIDEIYQVNNTEKFITEKLSRLAKFGIKPIISCHYINQLKYMRSELRSANTSYMLISGCDKKNYDEFKEELYPYQMDDLLHLPRYHSLNLIKYESGYARFITKLPKPLKSAK